MNLIFMIFGGLLALFSSFLVIVASVDLVSGSADTEPSVLWGILVFFSLTTVLGGYMAVKSRRQRIRKRQERREKKILKAIARAGGRVTPFELAAETDLSVDKAREYLDRLCELGMGELHVTDSGGLVYVFRGSLSDADKASARSPLESGADSSMN